MWKKRKKRPVHTDSTHIVPSQASLFISALQCDFTHNFSLCSLWLRNRNGIEKSERQDDWERWEPNQKRNEKCDRKLGLAEQVYGWKRNYIARNRWTNWWFSGLHHWVMLFVRTEVLSHNLASPLNIHCICHFWANPYLFLELSIIKIIGAFHSAMTHTATHEKFVNLKLFFLASSCLRMGYRLASMLP